MILRLGKLQIRVYIAILEKRIGVCSQASDKTDNHCLLWDFDRIELGAIRQSLRMIQAKYCLPTIRVVRSSDKGSYHAYCFAKRSFQETIHILSDTIGIDMTYLRLGMVRGYFTLRITPRKNDHIVFTENIPSPYPDETLPYDITTNEYYTNNKGGQNAKR